MRFFLLLCSAAFIACGQSIEIRETRRITMPGEVDSNSPAFWLDGTFHLINSTGIGPLMSRGSSQFGLDSGQYSTVTRPQRDWPTWIEAVWVDPSGSVFAWYHQEQERVCGPQRPAMPRIGAAVSYDGGHNFWDLGIILSSGDPVDCSSKNGYFAGGHGDFSVVLDSSKEYFYILFSNYGGAMETQGVVVARMAYQDRFYPVNAVWKYYEGGWGQPGLRGRTTPIFPAQVSWQRSDTNAFWGPSVHWNTFLRKYVVLLNHSCCGPNWPQEGIYASFNADLSAPGSWTKPKKILSDVFWYPQVLGIGLKGSDSYAGRRARLYVYGESKWDIIFHRSKGEPEDDSAEDDPAEDDGPKDDQPQDQEEPQQPVDNSPDEPEPTAPFCDDSPLDGETQAQCVPQSK